MMHHVTKPAPGAPGNTSPASEGGTSRQAALDTEQAKWLHVTEVARVLRISKNTAYAMVHDGRLRAFHVGRSIRVHLDDLRAMPTLHRAQSPPRLARGARAS